MKPPSALVLALLVVTSLAAMPLAAAEGGVSTAAAQPDTAPLADVTYVGDDDEPSTQETIGYVEGIRYDDELPVDDRDDAAVEEDELEAVVHRSMARVEVIRELAFEEDVPVEVVTREEFAEDDAFVNDLSAGEALFENVRLEALFMADRETDALEEYEALYGDAVAGYYDPATDEIVLVSDDLEAPELDEITLGHELLHALQDQHFGLQQYDRETTNQDHAKLGIIEGDAVWVDTRYEERCDADWDCVLPGTQPEPPTEFNPGLYFTLYQPYDDGPDYVDAVRTDGGWEAVDAVYDDPPTSSSEIIRPGEEREPVEIGIEDTSSEDWDRLEREDAPDYDVFGEATLAAMFMHQTVESPGSVGVEQEDVFDGVSALNFDHPVTDGWAGDEFVVYTAGESPEESAFVWQSEWLEEDEAEAFADGYLAVLEHHGAEPVEGDSATFVIDDRFPGAYHVDHDGETVTVVRAPSIDDLSAVDERATPDGDTVRDDAGDEAVEDDTADAVDDATGTDDPIPGFGVVVALLTLAGGLFVIGRRD